MKYTDCVVGGYYKITQVGDFSGYVIKVAELTKISDHDAFKGDTLSGGWYSQSAVTYTNNNWPLSMPTDMEIAHLNACIAAGKFVPADQIKTITTKSYEIY